MFPAWPGSHPSQNDPFLLHSFGTSFCQRNADLGQKIRAGFRWGEILRTSLCSSWKKLKVIPHPLCVSMGSHTHTRRRLSSSPSASVSCCRCSTPQRCGLTFRHCSLPVLGSLSWTSSSCFAFLLQALPPFSSRSPLVLKPSFPNPTTTTKKALHKH